MIKLSLIALLFSTAVAIAGGLETFDDPVVAAPDGACFPVMSELRPGEILYWTGNPAMGNCVTPVVDGCTRGTDCVVDILFKEKEEEGEKEHTK